MSNDVKFGNPDALYDPAPNGYSHVAIVPAGSRLVFCSGQGGETVDGKLADDFATQTEQAFENVAAALNWAGAEFTDVVKFTILVVDHDQRRLEVIVGALQARFTDRVTPTCTLIPVPRLALDGMLVEIEATAMLWA